MELSTDLVDLVPKSELLKLSTILNSFILFESTKVGKTKVAKNIVLHLNNKDVDLYLNEFLLRRGHEVNISLDREQLKEIVKHKNIDIVIMNLENISYELQKKFSRIKIKTIFITDRKDIRPDIDNVLFYDFRPKNLLKLIES